MRVKSNTINNIKNYTPKEVHTFLIDLAERYDFQLKVSRSRVTKYGDYRAPFGGLGHRISINENLNKYSFLLTLIHEIAHLIVWEAHKRDVKPHGNEWKTVFQSQMEILYALQVFRENILEEIKKSMQKPKATVQADPKLAIALRNYDDKTDRIFLNELEQDTIFKIARGRTFLKGDKLRTRFKCKELSTGKSYLFSPLAEVIPV